MLLSKRKAWRRWKVNPNIQTRANFNAATRRCSLAIRQYLAAEENNLLTAGPRKFFARAFQRQHPSDNSIVLESDHGIISSPSDICEPLSAEFSENFAIQNPNTFRANSLYNTPVRDDLSSLSNIIADNNVVRKILSQLNYSAAGSDGIPAVFYKLLAHWLATPLTIMFQQSLYQRKIPDDWRQAKIIPLCKGKRRRKDLASQRPISFTSVACKVLERIVVEQMKVFYTENSLITKSQRGFVPKRITVTNLMQCDLVIVHCT